MRENDEIQLLKDIMEIPSVNGVTMKVKWQNIYVII